MISLVKNNIFVICFRPYQASPVPTLVAATGNPATAVAIFEATVSFPSFPSRSCGEILAFHARTGWSDSEWNRITSQLHANRWYEITLPLPSRISKICIIKALKRSHLIVEFSRNYAKRYIRIFNPVDRREDVIIL